VLKIINKLCLEDKKVKAIFNAKNFGHIRSPYYGIFQAKGDAIILFAADFQDPLMLIPQLIEKWRHGSDVVFLKRKKTQENIFLEIFKNLFYKIRLYYTSLLIKYILQLST
jgi:glycosyltransferase involved in cell wall biosynthesis